MPGGEYRGRKREMNRHKVYLSEDDHVNKERYHVIAPPNYTQVHEDILSGEIEMPYDQPDVAINTTTVVTISDMVDMLYNGISFAFVDIRDLPAVKRVLDKYLSRLAMVAEHNETAASFLSKAAPLQSELHLGCRKLMNRDDEYLESIIKRDMLTILLSEGESIDTLLKAKYAKRLKQEVNN